MFASAFRSDYLPDTASITLLCDPKRLTYRALGFHRGLWTLFHPRVWLNGLRTLLKGYTQGATQADPLQDGGVLVLAADARVLYAYASTMPGDHPDPELVLAALSSL